MRTGRIKDKRFLALSLGIMEYNKKDSTDKNGTDMNTNRILLAFMVVLIITPSVLILGENLELPGNP